jgi:hypothetical protein
VDNWLSERAIETWINAKLAGRKNVNCGVPKGPLAPSSYSPSRWQKPCASYTPGASYVDDCKRHADHLRTELDHLEVPTSFIDNMNIYIKGSLAQANAGGQAQEDLLHTQAAELARATRQKRTRRSVLKGGIFYSSEARSITHQREEDEVEKADLALHRAQLAVERRDIAWWKKFFKEVKKKIKGNKTCRNKQL